MDRMKSTSALFIARLHACLCTALLGTALTSSLLASEPPALSAKDALTKLKQGNERFVAGEIKHDHASEGWRKSLVEGQHPFAVIVSCSDSRVPTELVFDQGFGDLFVIRNAGNIIATDVLGTIEYAMAHLGCRLVLVMGHESCGAVTAALMTEEDRAKEPPEVQQLIDDILVGLEKVKLPEDEKKRVAAGVEVNVRWSVQQLVDVLQERDPKGAVNVRIVGSVYELGTGKVRFLENSQTNQASARR